MMGPLPGTRTEAEVLTKILKLDATRVGMADQASEARLRQAKGPRILHIATHGFFLPDDPASGTRRQPMLRSGIALAGFNARAGAHFDDDGVLTALDVSGLDLYGTELVVLSACETGVGELTHGEGVFGLKRALLLAGARTQVLSLWKVDDRATQTLMSAFYRRLLAGEDRAVAMGAVQQDMLHGRLTAKGPTTVHAADRGARVRTPEKGPVTQVGWRHPYYWASFTVSGAAGPVEF
jgi:CHAT domain-containing protein